MIKAATDQTIQEAAKLLLAGEVVAIPTETVYGLAASIFNEAALARVFSVKERPSFDPLIVHVARQEQVEELVDFSRMSGQRQEEFRVLAARFWPGPLTCILPKKRLVPDLATSGLDTVAVRVPNHAVALQLIRLAGPLAAPSANRFGRISPTSAKDVESELGSRIPLVLDGGSCSVGVESTVLDFTSDEGLSILRPGAVTPEMISEVLGSSVSLEFKQEGHSFVPQALVSPGMLKSHYAPKTPLSLVELGFFKAENKFEDQSLALLLGQESDVSQEGVKDFLNSNKNRIQKVEFLSREGSLEEKAKNLFSKLRSLDAQGVDQILALDCKEDSGLGFAIYDRLKKASSKSQKSEI